MGDFSLLLVLLLPSPYLLFCIVVILLHLLLVIICSSSSSSSYYLFFFFFYFSSSSCFSFFLVRLLLLLSLLLLVALLVLFNPCSPRVLLFDVVFLGLKQGNPTIFVDNPDLGISGVSEQRHSRGRNHQKIVVSRDVLIFCQEWQKRSEKKAPTKNVQTSPPFREALVSADVAWSLFGPFRGFSPPESFRDRNTAKIGFELISGLL